MAGPKTWASETQAGQQVVDLGLVGHHIGAAVGIDHRTGQFGQRLGRQVRLFGHLWLSYRRNYLTTGHNFASGGENAVGEDTGFDAISEFVLRDAAAQAEMSRIAMANFAMIKEDEAKWFEQKYCWTMGCDSVEEDLQPRTSS